MRVAVVGGAGALGRFVCAALGEKGHEVRVLSRRSEQWPVDLRTGEGLKAALSSCEVVIDASNDNSRHANRTLVDGARRLLAAEAEAAVRHHVAVSIIGCERVPVGYFAAKAAQEQVVREGPVAWSIVRATQFHELVATSLEQYARWRVLPLPRVALQPVTATQVAAAVTDVALATPLRDSIEVAGPAVEDIRALASTWARITGHRVLRLPVWLPGKTAAALRTGALTNPRPDITGHTPFGTWLEQTHP